MLLASYVAPAASVQAMLVWVSAAQTRDGSWGEEDLVASELEAHRAWSVGCGCRVSMDERREPRRDADGNQLLSCGAK